MDKIYIAPIFIRAVKHYHEIESERAKGGYDNMIKELTHVAAVAVSAMECLMRERMRAE